MDLKTYIQGNRGLATKLAGAIGVSRSYLSQMAAGTSPISPERCVDIERETCGKVARRDLRPDDWERIWPELRIADDDSHAQRRKDDALPPAALQATGASAASG